jgi:Spy/CpxP family protein refolding chaperone
MRLHHLGVATLTLLLLAGGNLLRAADQPAAKKHGQEGHGRLDRLAAALGLSGEQKEKIRKIHHEFDQKEDKVEAQIHELRYEELEAASKVLNDAQRKEAHELFQAHMKKELHEIADKLSLSEEQRHKIGKIRAEYAQKIHQLHGQKGEELATSVRKLRHQEFHAIRHELTPEQRAKVPGVLREEMREWRNPAERREHLKALADKLNLSEGQREQLHKLHSEYDQKIHPLVEELHKVHHAEHEAVEQVLTSEQRAKLQQLHQAHHHHAKEGQSR